jgi:Mrp family chromosome partitioning ATPase
VLPVSDARLVAPLTDGVILLATAGTQKPASFQAALDRLALVDTRLLGIILNKAGQEDVDIGSYYRYEATAETAERLEAERLEAERRSAARKRADPPVPPAERPTKPPPRTAAPPVEQV